MEQAAQAEAITREHFARAIDLVVGLFGDSHRHDVRTVTAVAHIIAENHRALVQRRE
jgi:hypothetical protein